MPKLKKPSVTQVLKLADQLTLQEQEELCYKLSSKVRSITLTATVHPPSKEILEKLEKLDQLRKGAQEALRQSGVSVEELQAEAVKIREEKFARDYPNLADAS